MTVTTDWQVPEDWPGYAGEFQLPSFVEGALANIANHYDNVVHVPLPARRYWTIGQTAYDCEQCVLAVQQMFLGTAEIPVELTQCNGPRGVTFTVEVVRCVPGVDNRGRPPASESIEIASVNPIIDMEILLDLAKYFDPFQIGVLVNVEPIVASGGFHGVIATYSVSL